MKKKVETSYKTYNSMKDCKVKMRGIRMSNIGRQLSGSDFEEVKALFELHPCYAEKTLHGLEAIKVARSPGEMQHGFCFYIVDGAGNDISIAVGECIKPSSPSSNFNKACRIIAGSQCKEYKERYFAECAAKGLEPTCEASGTPICDITSEVDHSGFATFGNLVDSFVEFWKLDLSKIEYVGGQGGTFFKDKNITELFSNHHRAHCKLRVVATAVNSKGSTAAKVLRQKRRSLITLRAKNSP